MRISKQTIFPLTNSYPCCINIKSRLVEQSKKVVPESRSGVSCSTTHLRAAFLLPMDRVQQIHNLQIESDDLALHQSDSRDLLRENRIHASWLMRANEQLGRCLETGEAPPISPEDFGTMITEVEQTAQKLTAVIKKLNADTERAALLEEHTLGKLTKCTTTADVQQVRQHLIDIVQLNESATQYILRRSHIALRGRAFRSVRARVRRRSSHRSTSAARSPGEPAPDPDSLISFPRLKAKSFMRMYHVRGQVLGFFCAQTR